LVPECWRDVILAGRSRKSSATFGTPANVSLGERPPQTINTEPFTQDACLTLDVHGGISPRMPAEFTQNRAEMFYKIVFIFAGNEYRNILSVE
jgi:hypothetical protein